MTYSVQYTTSTKKNNRSGVLGLGDMAQKIITIIIFISVDIDNYHDKMSNLYFFQV